MQNSDFIIKWVESLKQDLNNAPYVEDDIRKDFFGMVIDSAYVYYRNFLLIEISILINRKKIDLKKLAKNQHLIGVTVLIKNERSHQSHNNAMNRQFLIDTYSTFEMCVTALCQYTCAEEENQKLLETGYNDIIKLINADKLSAKELTKLKVAYTVNHLTHVPIVRKTDALFKKVKGYTRDIKADKEFLRFFGKLRNAMHSNYIYSGKNYKYTFGHADFIFEDGKIITWQDPFKNSPKLYFYLAGNLNEIFKAITATIKYDGHIPYPDLQQE